VLKDKFYLNYSRKGLQAILDQFPGKFMTGVDQSIFSTEDAPGRLTPQLHTRVPILLVICGPTATGKSSLAITLAQRLNSAILSADSRQVYREFNIGTAKPNAFDQAQIPHYLIDLCEPTETLTLAEYQAQAQGLIAALQEPPVGEEAASRCALLVGGTGLYIKSIVRGLQIPRVAPQPDLRSQLTNLGQAHCYACLQQVDQAAAERIHPHDQVRTLRALEVFYVTGHPLSEQQGEHPPSYPILQIGLDSVDVATGDRRIEQRTQQMLDLGFAEEVQTLCEKYGADLPLLNTLGYAEMKPYVQGECALEMAKREIILHTRQFAKRQRTWFRADPSIVWFDADAPDVVEQVWQQVGQFYSHWGG
jgi:tRNA dimethylallyltransferase